MSLTDSPLSSSSVSSSSSSSSLHSTTTITSMSSHNGVINSGQRRLVAETSRRRLIFVLLVSMTVLRMTTLTAYGSSQTGTSTFQASSNLRRASEKEFASQRQQRQDGAIEESGEDDDKNNNNNNNNTPVVVVAATTAVAPQDKQEPPVIVEATTPATTTKTTTTTTTVATTKEQEPAVMVDAKQVTDMLIQQQQQQQQETNPTTNMPKIIQTNNATKTLKFAENLELPLQAFEEWKSWHNREVLAAELKAHHKRGQPLPDRKFIVGLFSCPEQAGNLLHNFFNQLVVAVVTNRTLVMHYKVSNLVYEEQNVEENCARVLEVAEWVPRFTKLVRDSYGLNKVDRVHIAPEMHKDGPYPYHDSYRADPSVRLWSTKETAKNQNAKAWTMGKLYHFNMEMDNIWTGLVNLNDDFGRTFFSQLFGFEDSKYANRQIAKLWTNGNAFLYGMLVRQTLRFTKEVQDSVATYMKKPKGLSIALHARHPKPGMDGNDVTAEVACLDQLLQDLRQDDPEKACTLYVMTDRVPTVGHMRQAAEERQCHFVHVKAEADTSVHESDNIEVREHGPFAGSGYFRDWIVASQARSAMISGLRSSSALIYELMTYDGMMEGTITAPPQRCITY